MTIFPLNPCEFHSIANRDIKPDNFIITKDGNGEFYYKIADFGIGCQLSTFQKTLLIKDCPEYTELYAAPELIYSLGNESYNPFKADVFSLGITILKMMGLSSNQIRVLKKDFILSEIEQNIRKGYEKILAIAMRMLNKIPEERPNFFEINKIFGLMQKIKPHEKDNFKRLEEKIDNLSNEQKVKKYEKMFYLYNKINDNEKSIHFAQLCLNLNERLKEKYNYKNSNWNFLLGCFYQEECNLDLAIKCYKKANEILFEIGESFRR